jgi:hypothetical protein
MMLAAPRTTEQQNRCKPVNFENKPQKTAFIIFNNPGPEDLWQAIH